MEKKMDAVRIILKIIMWFLIAGFGCSFILQTLSYSFYKNAKKTTDISCAPQFIRFNETLTGYGNNLDLKNSGKVVLFFGGSYDIAYNAVGKYAARFPYPFISADYYGTQDSKGKMNLKTMKKTAEALYDWAREHYPDSEIVIMGHSYGAGIAAFLASVRECRLLIIAAGYRDVSDLYNKIIPIFRGPLKVFITNNIRAAEYAENVKCPVFVLGSDGDKVLSFPLQEKVARCFENAKVKKFENIAHEDYFRSDEVVRFIIEAIESSA